MSISPCVDSVVFLKQLDHAACHFGILWLHHFLVKVGMLVASRPPSGRVLVASAGIRTDVL